MCGFPLAADASTYVHIHQAHLDTANFATVTRKIDFVGGGVLVAVLGAVVGGLTFCIELLGLFFGRALGKCQGSCQQQESSASCPMDSSARRMLFLLCPLYLLWPVVLPTGPGDRRTSHPALRP